MVSNYSEAAGILAQLASLYDLLAQAYRASDLQVIEQTKQQIEKLEQVYKEIKRTTR